MSSASGEALFSRFRVGVSGSGFSVGVQGSGLGFRVGV
jgi:hypothetical protein